MECQLEKISVSYEVRGQGAPMLMLPGWGADSRFMRMEIEPLFRRRKGWQRIYIDPPGHGMTPGQDWITNQDHMLEVILDFIDHVIPGQRLALFGVSAGAYHARGVVYYRQRLIDGLCMVVPLIQAQDTRRTLPARTVLIEEPGLATEVQPDEAEMFEIVVVRTRHVIERFRRYPTLSGGLGDAEFLERIRQDPEKYAFSFDVDSLSAPLSAPTLVITAKQDCVVGFQDAWDITKNYPRATYAVLDYAGHFLEEKEPVVQALVDEWLDRMEAWKKTSSTS